MTRLNTSEQRELIGHSNMRQERASAAKQSRLRASSVQVRASTGRIHESAHRAQSANANTNTVSHARAACELNAALKAPLITFDEPTRRTKVRQPHRKRVRRL